MFMKLAIEEAQKTTVDVPVGAVVIKNGEVICACHNRREEDKNITSHAEILAIKEACKKLNTRYLNDCELYVTLEPCPMCSWAILDSHIKSVYFGSYDTQYGALGSKIDLRKISNSNPDVYGGIMEEDCNLLLQLFFNKLRNIKK